MTSSKLAASRPEARLIADSILSFGMFTARAFWIARRSSELVPGSGPAFLTEIVMSLPIRLNCFAIRFQRANIACFLTSKMRPMAALLRLGLRAARRGARNLTQRRPNRTPRGLPTSLAIVKVLLAKGLGGLFASCKFFIRHLQT